MDAGNDGRVAQQRPHSLRVFSPQDGDEGEPSALGGTAACDGGNGRRRDGFPALSAVGAGGTLPDAEDPVEQQDALPGPGAQVAVDACREPEIGLKLPVNVDQTARNGARAAVHRERQPDGMPRRGVRILAHDQHPHARQRLAERTEDVRRRWQHPVPLRHFSGQEGQHRPQLSLHTGQRRGPVRGQQLIEGHPRHLGKAGASGPDGSRSNSGSGSITPYSPLALSGGPRRNLA